MVWDICTKFGTDMQAVILNKTLERKLLSRKSKMANGYHVEFQKSLFSATVQDIQRNFAVGLGLWHKVPLWTLPEVETTHFWIQDDDRPPYSNQ